MIIRIKNLKVQAIIGVYEYERTQKQALIFNVELAYNAKNAMQSDNLEDALDYDLIKQQIITIAETSEFQLIERLADQVLAVIIDDDERISRVTVEIDKPAAMKEAESVSFSATLQR